MGGGDSFPLLFMANTQLQIINKALVLCGAATVQSITDGSPNANALNNVYQIALQDILGECNWNFARMRAILTVTTSPLAFMYPGEAFVYPLNSVGLTVDGGFASLSGSTLASWSTGALASVSLSTTVVYTGSTYGVLITSSAASIGIFQNLSYYASLSQQTVTFSIAVSCGTTGLVKAFITDSSGTTYAPTTAAGTWTTQTVTRTIVEAPTSLSFGVYLTTNGTCYVDTASATYSLSVIRILSTYPQSATWREESGNLVSDTAGLGLVYTTYDLNEADFPSYFLSAFIDRLCSEIAYVIINSPQVAQAFVQKYETVSLPKAMSANSQTGVQQVPIDANWTNAKFYDGSGGYDPSWGAVAP